MKCGSCGNELREGAEFCSFCGEKVQSNNLIKKPNSLKKSYWIVIGIAGLLAIIILLLILLLRNGKKSDTIPKVDESTNSVEELPPVQEQFVVLNDEIDEATEEITDNEDLGEIIDYKSAYREAIINEFGDYVKDFSFDLIYINDDDIPELYYSGDCEASGSGVIYMNPQGESELVMMSRIAGTYEKRGNFYYHSQGHMGYYYDEFYSFVDGEFVCTNGGSYVDTFDENAIDSEGNKGAWVVLEATFNNETMSFDAYNQKVDALLEGRELINLQEGKYTYNGEDIPIDVYWEHYGEAGYEWTLGLYSYDEIMELLQ